MAPLRFIVKLGGAAITDKNSLETVNEAVMQEAVEQLRRAYEINAKADFIVVHGAGSFGHFQASQGEVAKGGLHIDSVKRGFLEARLSVTKLNHLLVSKLVAARIPAVGVSPCGHWRSTNRQASLIVEEIAELLEAGLIPVLHGDCVLDDALGCTVLSGDVIVKHLCQYLDPKCVIFLTNVDGLFDRSPEQEDAELIKDITVHKNGQWAAQGIASSVAFSTQAHDTTGGIHAKVEECAAIARGGLVVLICKAASNSSLRALLHGAAAFASPRWRGTRISAAAESEDE